MSSSTTNMSAFRPRRPSFFLSLAPATSAAYFPPAVDTTVDIAPVERPAVRRSSSAASDESQAAVGFRFLALGHTQDKDTKTTA